MEQQVEFKIAQTGESVTVRVSAHNKLLPCIEEIDDKTVLHTGFKISKYKSFVIKCIIDKNERIKITKVPGFSGESIFPIVVDQFIKDNFSTNKLVLSETAFCNIYEIQYKFLIVA